MANRFLVPGGNGNWDNNNNWASTSGGGSGASFPVAGDVVTFDSNSGAAAMTVNVASACASLTMSGTYTGTLTFTSTLTLTAGCTFISGCTIAGTSGTLIINNSNQTITSGGKILTCAMTLASAITITLGDNWTVNGTLQIAASAVTTTVNANQITAKGNLTINGTNGISTGTTTIVMGGTGTWSHNAAGGTLQNNLTFNTSGTITCSGTTRYSKGTITYTAGTMVVSGHTLDLNEGGNPCTLNTNGMTWVNINTQMTSGNITISSNLNYSGAFTIQNTTTINASGGAQINYTGTSGTALAVGGFIFSGTAPFHFNNGSTGTWSDSSGNCRIDMFLDSGSSITSSGTLGLNTSGNGSLTLNATFVNSPTLKMANSYTITCNVANQTFATLNFNPTAANATLTCNGTNGFSMNTLSFVPATNASGQTIIFKASLTYTINTTMTCTGTAANPVTIKSDTGGVQTILTVVNGSTQDVFCNGTDVDSSQGATVWSFNATLSNTLNWNVLSSPSTVTSGIIN